MVVCVKIMSKGSKEALTVLIVTHATVLMSKGPCMSKGSKVILTFNPFDMLQHTLHWMVWLERSKSQFSKTFLD